MKKNNFWIVFMLLFDLSIACHAYADGVTIVTHGWNPSANGTPVWLESMRNAVSDNHLGGEKNYGMITVTKSGSNLVANCDPWNFDLTSGTGGEILIILDWSAVADHLTGGPSAQDVAKVIIDKMVIGQKGKAPLAELPIHLIGHSRGGSMICEIARLLGEKGILVDHLTPLDPHPLTASDPQPFLTKIIDTPTAIYENVVFADVYLQNTEGPKGESVSGAYNRVWGAMNGGYYKNGSVYPNHRNIYLMYQGTADLKNPVNNGEASIDSQERSTWFADEESCGDQTGFCFSRIKGTAVRKSDGLHKNPLIGGNGVRQNLLWSEAVWSNIADMQVRQNSSDLGHGRHVIPIGTKLDLRYVVLDYNSSSTVTLLADIDRNPYNNNDIESSLIAPIQHSVTGNTFIENTVNWDTSGMSDGQEAYIYAKISDGSHTRYFYAPTLLVFSKYSLSSVIAILRLMAGLSPDISLISDINGDRVVGLEEAVYYLQEIAELRN